MSPINLYEQPRQDVIINSFALLREIIPKLAEISTPAAVMPELGKDGSLTGRILVSMTPPRTRVEDALNTVPSHFPETGLQEGHRVTARIVGQKALLELREQGAAWQNPASQTD